METDKDKIGSLIKNIRLQNGLTMQEFGEKLNTSKGAVNNWEKGVNLPSKDRMKKISEMGNMTVSELLYGSPRDYAYNVLIEELNDYGKLWYTLKSYVQEKQKLIDNEEIYKASVKLISEHFDKIYSSLRTHLLLSPSLKNKNIYDNHNLIIQLAINEFTSKREFTFEEYYDRLVNSINALGSRQYKGSIEELADRLIRKGYGEEEAKKKAIDNYFINKTTDQIDNFKKEIKEIYKEYENIKKDN